MNDRVSPKLLGKCGLGRHESIMENIPEKTAADWGNYWQGRAASRAGAALVGVGIENNADIETHWMAFFSKQRKTASLLDVACGAGSVIGMAISAGLNDISGVDISSDAIVTLKTTYPLVKAKTGQASALPFEDQSFDVVTSQFGFEYDDAVKAVKDMARVLKSDGQFHAVCHKRQSVISREVHSKADVAGQILESDFIEAAKTVFTIDMTGGEDAEFSTAAQNFSPKQARVMALAKQSGGLAAHLYQGTQTLFENRKAYDLTDITDWLDGMESEIKAFYGRMTGMLNAALSEADIMAITGALHDGGVMCEEVVDIVDTGRGGALGCVISGVKAISV